MACQQRIGVLLVGPPGSGKSTLWRVLQAAYRLLGLPLQLHVLSPKAVPRPVLLGHVDADTREWSDGVLTAAVRAMVRQEVAGRAWLVCDGDVDPEWIESLNSVLDDNRYVTLWEC